jgi:acetolactate synthase-1/2/3 large subunit
MPRDVLPSARAEHPVALPPSPHPEAIARAAALIAQSRRPMIVADTPAAFAGAGAGLRRLARDCGIPVLGMGLARGLVPEEAPFGYSWPYGQRAAAHADCIIVVGAPLDMRFGYGLAPRFNADAPVIHLSEQPNDIGRNRPVTVPVLGGLATATEKLANALAATAWRGDPQWIVTALAEREARVDAVIASREGSIHQLQLAEIIDTRLPRRRLIAGDGADVVNYLYARLRVYEDGAYADHNPFGSMGMGLPLALGMAAAERELGGDRPTVLVTGDGSIGFYLAELDSIRRAELKIIVAVSNDGVWGPEYAGQMLVHGRAANTALDGCDYAQVARGFGLGADRVETLDELSAAMDRALESPIGHLLDVRIGLEGGVQRKTDPLMCIVMFDDIERK